MNKKKVISSGFLGFIITVYVIIYYYGSRDRLSDTELYLNRLLLDKLLSGSLNKLNKSNQIIRIIHQSWKYARNIPRYFSKTMLSWKKCFSDWEHVFWTDEDNRNLVVEHYSWFLKKYDSFPRGIYRADCSRYFYMFHYGGMYTDLDNECLRPFEHLLLNYTMVFGDINHVPIITNLMNGNYVQNSFMYSKPNHPFWLELILEILHTESDETPDIVTGPFVLSNMIQRYRDRYPSSHGIKIYEGRYFNPITWGNKSTNHKSCKIWNQMSESEYEECRKYHLDHGSFVVQYHSHTWG